MNSNIFQKYLQETSYLDFNHHVFDFFLSEIDPNQSQKEIAIDLYFKIRDQFLYDPYHLDLREQSLKASKITLKKRAWCVEKSILLAACTRKYGIPSRLGFSIVTNHIGVDKLTKYLKKNEIVFHGFVEVYLNEKWIKCTPAFDRNICRISKVAPLDWDGENDSLFQAYIGEDKFMEYNHFYGNFNDVPVQLMNDEMKKHYPHLFEKEWNSKEFSFFYQE
jgi:transglutaminase-like putative cysteine protease